MNNKKILHLFPKLLSLYGEYGNVAVLRRGLETLGFSVTVDTYEDGDLSLEGYDLIYVGAGTEDNLLEAVRRLLPYREQIVASIDAGCHYLATCNAMTLFGSQIQQDGQVLPALDCFPFSTTVERSKRYLADVLTEDHFGGPLVGFINTSCVYQGIDTPLLQLRLNSTMGNTKSGKDDGIHVNNFYGTQLVGPVLAKNPHFLAYMCQALTGQSLTVGEDSSMQKAYRIALQELSARV